MLEREIGKKNKSVHQRLTKTPGPDFVIALNVWGTAVFQLSSSVFLFTSEFDLLFRDSDRAYISQMLRGFICKS